jgi:hypothetical protein
LSVLTTEHFPFAAEPAHPERPGTQFPLWLDHLDESADARDPQESLSFGLELREEI